MAAESYAYKNIYPKTKKVRLLVSADLTQGTTNEEEAMFAVFQGLVNREEPRAYLCHSHGDRFRKGLGADDSLWVDYYERRFGIDVERLSDPYDLFDRFGPTVEGVIIYDREMMDTFNLAVMLCGRQNCVPVTPELQMDLAKKFEWGGNIVDDLRGRFENAYELNLWAHENLQPSCNRHIVVQRLGLGPLIYIYDFVVAHNLFLFNLSHSMKDRKEAALVDRIYQAMDRPGHVMGWFADRTMECEYAARTARNGCFITCNGAPNLSFHIGIDAQPRFTPRKLTDARKKAEKKVYITFVYTDGDALWCLNDFFDGVYNEEGRGEVPIGWEVQILNYHLSPGVLQYYAETMTDNDCPVASVSGAGYTYPNLHPDSASYMKYTEEYMKLTGVEYIFAGLSSPYDALYWLDPESRRLEIVEDYRKHVPSAKGILRAYGGGGLMLEHSIETGQTPVVCTTAHLGKGHDMHKEIEKIIAKVDHRPLFISIHTGTNTPPGMMIDVAKALTQHGHEVLLIDEWFAKMQSAVDNGWLGDGLYPNREKLIARHGEHEREMWKTSFRKTVEKTLQKSLLPDDELERLPPDEFPAIWHNGQPGNEKVRTVSTLDDDLAFSVLFTAQVLAGCVSKCTGFYENELSKLEDFFRTEMSSVEDIEVLAECIDAWRRWEETHFTTEQAKAWAQRMLELLPRLDREWNSAEENNGR